MLIPPLSRRSNAFVERNLFLHAVLGFRQFGERFCAYVAYVVRETEARSGDVTPVFERDVLLVLGLVSLWRRCEQRLDAWSHAGASPTVCIAVEEPKRAQRGLGALFR